MLYTKSSMIKKRAQSSLIKLQLNVLKKQRLISTLRAYEMPYYYIKLRVKNLMILYSSKTDNSQDDILKFVIYRLKLKSIDHTHKNRAINLKKLIV